MSGSHNSDKASYWPSFSMPERPAFATLSRINMEKWKSKSLKSRKSKALKTWNPANAWKYKAWAPDKRGYPINMSYISMKTYFVGTH